VLLALHTGSVRQEEASHAAGADPGLLRELARLPDFTATLAWELRSVLLAPLLRRFAPSDSYALTKRGASLRVDGSLKGLSDSLPGAGAPSGAEEEGEAETAAEGLLPRWERGSFSLLIHPQHGQPTRLWYVDHDKREVVDAAAGAEPRSAHQLAQDVDEMLGGGGAAQQGGRKSKLKLQTFDFAPLKNWRGLPRREPAEGWPDCLVYSAKGKVASEEKKCGDRSQLVAAASFDAYQARARRESGSAAAAAAAAAGEGAAAAATEADAVESEDEAAEAEAGAEAEAARAGRGVQPAASAPKRGKAHRFRGTVWLAQGHPLSVRSLFPLFDVCAAANKHFHKVRRCVSLFLVLRLHLDTLLSASCRASATWTPAPCASKCRCS